ncbi:hypothetical protein J2X01_000429 [Arthrobacter ginsengisoli]|uniref:DUF4232 domain-containing protein n=1 Tax=Arthrobacter ginsengisoli TaxID=1356565 RepID=A0ABU1U7S1_9MICC|nr:hypothetical protein [Arthrobacter ginsengisoli]MDR7081160.1 hypothetical protein [Arthrobacter ginsengisoli]
MDATVKLGIAKLAVALLLAAGTAGCSGPIACPAIAWSNSLTVTLDGSVENVALVELCAADVCSVRMDSPVPFPSTSVSPGAVPAPVAPGPPSALSAPPSISPLPASSSMPFSSYTASRIDDRTWKVSFLMQSPKHVTVRALAADGTVLAEREVDLGWTRVGGSEQCGGPATAGPIGLAV